jgi:typhoid toxin secretion A
VSINLFDMAFEHTVGLEGGYCNDPSDSGGATCYGITEAVAREWGYTGEMCDLPLDTAKAIYKQNYWDRMLLDDVGSLAPDVALEMFDTGVNCGTGTAVKFLQKALNRFNNQGTIYADIDVDGGMGPQSLDALYQYVDYRGDEGVDVLAVSLNCLQGAYYFDISESSPKNEKFVYGWMLNRVAL